MQIPNPPPMNRFNIPIYRKFQEHFMDKIIEYTVLKDKLAIRTNQILIDTNLKIEKLCKNERILIDQFFKITANNEVYFKKGVEDEIGINAIKNYYKCCNLIISLIMIIHSTLKIIIVVLIILRLSTYIKLYNTNICEGYK